MAVPRSGITEPSLGTPVSSGRMNVSLSCSLLRLVQAVGPPMVTMLSAPAPSTVPLASLKRSRLPATKAIGVMPG